VSIPIRLPSTANDDSSTPGLTGPTRPRRLVFSARFLHRSEQYRTLPCASSGIRPRQLLQRLPRRFASESLTRVGGCEASSVAGLGTPALRCSRSAPAQYSPGSRSPFAMRSFEKLVYPALAYTSMGAVSNHGFSSNVILLMTWTAEPSGIRWPSGFGIGGSATR
jgi:hypothetical protein